MPSLDWEDTRVGLRITFGPKSQDQTLARFREQHLQAQEAATAIRRRDNEQAYIAPPQTLRVFLESEFRHEYEFRYFVLDIGQFTADFEQSEDYEPLELIKDQGRTGRDIANSLVKTDFLHAQRHLSDSAGGSRSEELSRHLSRYYSRNLEKLAQDFNAIKVLAESEALLNEHLEQVFSETLERLSALGYPGFSNPRLLIKSALNPATVMSSSDGAHIHYALDEEGFTLPDKYNGLGFKNLIYMVVELLDLHAQWTAFQEDRPPLHLVFVEEPEAHLHAQLQQVFVNKVLDILAEDDVEIGAFQSQLVLTTHSPHILFERGFRPIRYFRRENSGTDQTSSVLNLSEFYQRTANPSRDFLERYLRLTHCDLFFADAAVLVEGSVERLVMPQMIQKSAPGLRSSYLSILEIGGAFAHRFRSLMEFLGITTLIITDLDSVRASPLDHGQLNEAAEVANPDGESNAADEVPGGTCTPETPNAVTSNQMLRQWLPRRERIDELLAIGPNEKTLESEPGRPAAVRVTYPCTVELVRPPERLQRAGRTFEAAFAYENLELTQDNANQDLNLRVSNVQDIEEMARRLHDRIHSSNFRKTDFALALLSKEPDSWTVPQYIRDGLQWLERELGFAEPLEPPEARGAEEIGPR